MSEDWKATGSEQKWDVGENNTNGERTQELQIYTTILT
jgi:hypothetical protein